MWTGMNSRSQVSSRARTTSTSHVRCRLGLVVLAASWLVAAAQDANVPPSPRGQIVDLGGHGLHVDCTGKGAPTIVLEGGFDTFSFEWTLVQSALSESARVCAYDRAGYAWSSPGPKPRTLAQVNLELHDALSKLGEHDPFVLVGHAFGGTVVRNYALTYPSQVASVVLVDAESEEDRFELWQRAVLKREGARGRSIPTPRESMTADDAVEVATYYQPGQVATIAPPFDRLASSIQRLRLWARPRRSLAAAEENEREWAPEYLARWHADPPSGHLGAIPLFVLARRNVAFHDLDISAQEQELTRKHNQNRLQALSTISRMQWIDADRDIRIEKP